MCAIELHPLMEGDSLRKAVSAGLFPGTADASNNQADCGS